MKPHETKMYTEKGSVNRVKWKVQNNLCHLNISDKILVSRVYKELKKKTRKQIT